MLILGRKVNETIVIGGEVYITIVEVRGNRDTGYYVKLGIEAPKDKVIDRLEIHDARQPDGSRQDRRSPERGSGRPNDRQFDKYDY